MFVTLYVCVCTCVCVCVCVHVCGRLEAPLVSGSLEHAGTAGQCVSDLSIWSLPGAHTASLRSVCVCVRVCVCVCVFLEGRTLQAVTVPETLTNKLICFPLHSLSLSLSPHTATLHLSRLRSVAEQHLSIIYSLYSQQKAQRIAPLISIRHLVLSFFSLAGTATHTHAHTHTCTHTHIYRHTHTRGALLPFPHSAMQITGFVACVAKTVVAGVCGVLCASVVIVCLRVCGCFSRVRRVHVLRLVLACAGGVAYGCRVGWALLCTPGVKWTV